MSTINDEDFVSIGQRFKQERETLGLTQRALATRIFTSEKTIIGYESGAVLPKLKTLVHFYGAGADLLYILVGERTSPDSLQRSTPAAGIASKIAAMSLSEADAALLMAFADRLSKA